MGGFKSGAVPLLTSPPGPPQLEPGRFAGKCGFLNIYRGCGNAHGAEEGGKGREGRGGEAGEGGGGQWGCWVGRWDAVGDGTGKL